MSTVSLDDLEKRMKMLETNLIRENREVRKTPNLDLPFGQATSKPTRPSSGLDLSNNRSSQLTRPNSGLSLSTGGSARPNRPSSGLDLSSSGSNSPAIRRKKEIASQLLINAQPPKGHESVEVSKRLQEVISQNGKLRIKDKMYKAIASDFENLGEIGSGTCGQVYRMRFKSANHIMAVKQMHRTGNSEESKRILMDLDIVQKSHDCPHIVTCYGTLITESDVWICMELMATCFDKLIKKIKGPTPEKIIGKLSVAVVKALNYLKENHGVIHRDVKPSNILIDLSGQIKLCDFGISGRLVDSKAKTRSAGCAAYMAPERIDPPDPTRPDYDIRADVWSLGVSLVELATGIFPYQNCKTDFEVLTKVLQQESPTLPKHLNFSVNFQQFVSLCCTKDYLRRPKYRELLEHGFIKQYENDQTDVAAWLNSVLFDQTNFYSQNNPFGSDFGLMSADDLLGKQTSNDPFLSQSNDPFQQSKCDPFLAMTTPAYLMHNSVTVQPQAANTLKPLPTTTKYPDTSRVQTVDDLLKI